MGIILDEKNGPYKLFIDKFEPIPVIDLQITSTPVVVKARKMKVRWGPYEDETDRNNRYWDSVEARNAGRYCLVFGEEWLKWVGP